MAAVRPAVVLARSRCLAVSAVLEGADLQPDAEIEARVSELARSLEPLSPRPEWDELTKAKWYATAYGGLVLVYTCGPVTPISRITVSRGISLARTAEAPRLLDDGDVLRAWATMWAGGEDEGLAMISGPLHDRPGISWSPGGGVRVALRGIVY